MKQPFRTALHAVGCFLLALAISSIAGAPATAAGAGTALPDREETPHPDGEWELIRDDDGIRTYRMQRPGSPLLAFKGQGVIDASIDLVLSVCLDAERSGEWIGLLSESAVLRWVDGRRAYVQFSRFDLPWPVWDRVFVSEVVLEVDPDGYAATLAYHESDEAPTIDDAILGSTAGTRFQLRSIDGGTRTLFTGIGIADPKGAIPVWFVNWAGRSVPHRTIQALRRQVRKDDVSVWPLVEALFEDLGVQR